MFAVDDAGTARRVYRSTRGIGPVSRSADGRHIAFRVGHFGSDIVTVDLVTDEFRTWACECGDPYVTGRETVVFDGERRMFRLPLDGGDAVVTQPTCRRRNWVTTSRRRCRWRPGRRVVAFPEQAHIDACRTRGSVAVFNVRTERKRSLPAPGRGAWQVVELGYDADGRLLASWVRTSWTEEDDCVETAGPALFRWASGDWRRVKRDVTWFSFSDSGARASVAQSPDGSFTGTLSVPSDEGRVPVADGVYDVSW